MELFKMALTVVIIFLCVYAIVDRICKCVENRAKIKALGALGIVQAKKEDFEECLQK